MEIVIDDLLGQPGTTYKRNEVEAMKAAIQAFRGSMTLKEPELVVGSYEQCHGRVFQLKAMAAARMKTSGYSIRPETVDGGEKLCA